MDFLNQLNVWSKEFAPLIQLLMMLAVTAATVTALWATWRSRQDQKVQIEYECEISSILMPRRVDTTGVATYEKSHETVTATLTNVGLRPTSIPWIAFGMAVPHSKRGALLQPTTDYRADAPLSLGPGERKSFELRSASQLREEIFGLKFQWFPRLRIRRLRLTFATESNDVFRAKVGKTLRAHINETAAQTNWIYQKNLTATDTE